MILTWATCACGLIGFGLQIVAHILMWEGGKPERAPVARYAVGLCIVGLGFSIGMALDWRQESIIAFWYHALMGGAATGLCYELRRRNAERPSEPPMNRDALDMWADVIAGEHDEA
jgi:hypothetical protein